MFWQYISLLIIIPVILFCFLTITIFVLVPLAFIVASWYMRIKQRKLERRKRDGPNVAFFHPYCNAGGGGERVLWVAVKAMLARYPDAHFYIYTVDTNKADTILTKATNTFNVKLDASRIQFIRLNLGKLIDASMYPYFTLLLQSLGGMLLGLEAFTKLNPDVFIDTMGCAFTYPIFRYLAQCPVISYTHYPTITTAMMKRVKHRVHSYNNSSIVARNPVLTWCKLLYYKVFGWLYGIVGRRAHSVMANGTWTHDHLVSLWTDTNLHKVYPPCDVSSLKKLPSLVREDDPIVILSVAQFRPEKDHPLMLNAMYELRNLLVKNEALWDRIKLVLVGSCRSPADEERVRNLRDLARHLALDDHVQFKVNASYSQLLQLYQTSTLAMHAMWNEHFGISVVECMAAGLIVIAHRSGGPSLDLVTSNTGYLASDPPEYAAALLDAIALTAQEKKDMVEQARASVERFSDAEFEKSFLRVIAPSMNIE